MSAALAIGAFKAAFEFLNEHRYLARFIIRWSIQPLLTVVFLIGGVAIVGHYAQKDSAFQELMTAFFGSPLDILAKRTAIELAVTQAQIGVDANANRVIDQLLTAALERVNTGARLRLAVIHNGTVGVTGMTFLRADITNAIARPGRATGDLSTNLPMGALATFSLSMLDGSCWLSDTDKLSFNPGREHLERIAVKTFLACPVRDPNNSLLGEIAMHWDRGDAVPVGEEMAAVTRALKITADQLGAIINLRTNSYAKPSDAVNRNN